MSRVLFIAMNLNSGGAERQMASISLLLKQRGYDVDIVCFAEGDFYAQRLADNGVRVIWIIEPKISHRIFRVRKFVRQGHYDAVISLLDSAGFLNNFSAVGAHSWKVITGERSAQIGNLVSFKGRVYGFMQRFSDVLVCNSENARQMWCAQYPRYSSKVITIYNTVVVNPISSDYEMCKDGRKHIIVAASYRALKNPLTLAKAVSMLTDTDRQGLCIDWYGNKYFEGSVGSECDSIVEKYQLEDTLHFYDQTHDMANLMYESDVVALFSSVEGLPNAICEGLYLGKPIVMSKVSDYEVLVDDENGFLCDGNSARSICEVLRKLLTLSNNKLLEMGEASKRKAISLFDQEKIINRWIQIIK